MNLKEFAEKITEALAEAEASAPAHPNMTPSITFYLDSDDSELDNKLESLDLKVVDIEVESDNMLNCMCPSGAIVRLKLKKW